MKTLDELRATPASVECEHGASQRSCDACEALALHEENAGLRMRVAELEGELKQASYDWAQTREHWRGVNTKLQAQLDRANLRIDEQDARITELCDQLENEGASRVIAENKLDRATKTRADGVDDA